MISAWERWPFCNVCGARGWPYGTSADLANTLKRLCKKCGTCGDFEIRTVRWIRDRIWWNPWSWDRGHWKKKEGEQQNPETDAAIRRATAKKFMEVALAARAYLEAVDCTPWDHEQEYDTLVARLADAGYAPNLLEKKDG